MIDGPLTTRHKMTRLYIIISLSRIPAAATPPTFHELFTGYMMSAIIRPPAAAGRVARHSSGRLDYRRRRRPAIGFHSHDISPQQKRDCGLDMPSARWRRRGRSAIRFHGLRHAAAEARHTRRFRYQLPSDFFDITRGAGRIAVIITSAGIVEGFDS